MHNSTAAAVPPRALQIHSTETAAAAAAGVTDVYQIAASRKTRGSMHSSTAAAGPLQV
jgi:hypothetical protein